MAVQIPLFPLNAVLFPHMPMALHVFEDRYRTMIRDCLDGGTTFGVVAIREGREVGAAAEPHSVGTLAQLRNIEELPDGRYDIGVVGASRFRIDALSHTRPYLTGAVTYLQDAPASGDAQALAGRVAAGFREYAAAMRALSKQEAPDIELPDEPELLSYLVAAALRITVPERQRLLQIDSAEERLRVCLAVLRRERVLLDTMVGHAVAPSTSTSLN